MEKSNGPLNTLLISGICESTDKNMQIRTDTHTHFQRLSESLAQSFTDLQYLFIMLFLFS